MERPVFSSTETDVGLDRWKSAEGNLSRWKVAEGNLSRWEKPKDTLESKWPPSKTTQALENRWASKTKGSLDRWTSIKREKVETRDAVDKLSETKVEKTEIEVITDALLKGKNIAASIKKTNETTSSALVRALRIISANAKPLIYVAAASVAVALAVALANIYITGASWYVLLNILKNLGIKVLPSILLKAMQNAGVSVVSNMSINAVLGLAEKNPTVARILAIQVKPEFLRRSLQKVGIDITRKDLSLKSITRTAISASISIGTGNVSSFLISTSVSTAISSGATAATSVVEKISSTVSSIKDKVADAIFNGKEETNVIKIASEVHKGAVKEKIIPKTKRQTETVKPLSFVSEMVAENKLMATATFTTIALTGIALASDPSALADLLKIGTDTVLPAGMNFIKENTTARTALFGIITEKVGVNAMMDRLGTALNPIQRSKVASLNMKKPGAMDELFALLLGEKLYTEKEIDSMDIKRLGSVAKTKNIKFTASPNVTAKALRDAIKKEQNERLNSINSMVASTLGNALKGAVSVAAMEYTYQNMPYSTLDIQGIEEEIKKAEQDIETPKTRTQSQDEIDKEWNTKQKQEQDRLADERTQRKAERDVASETKKANAELERQARIEKTKATAAIRDAARRLRSAAILEGLTKDIGVIIADTEGMVKPLPADDILLDPKMQKVLEGIEFTPLLQYMASKTASSAVSWIPGIGWVNSVIEMANTGMDTLEKVKDMGNIIRVALELTGDVEGEVSQEKLDLLDSMLKTRLPSVSAAISDMIKLDKINLKKITLETLRDKALYGWDNARVALELGKKVVVGPGSETISDSILTEIGKSIWSST